MDTSNDVPVKPGHIKIIKLAREGTLQPGDVVETSTLGKCTVAYIRNATSICVKRANGTYHTLPDICWPGKASLISAKSVSSASREAVCLI
jgi:hypothetical protein